MQENGEGKQQWEPGAGAQLRPCIIFLVSEQNRTHQEWAVSTESPGAHSLFHKEGRNKESRRNTAKWYKPVSISRRSESKTDREWRLNTRETFKSGQKALRVAGDRVSAQCLTHLLYKHEDQSSDSLQPHGCQVSFQLQKVDTESLEQPAIKTSSICNLRVRLRESASMSKVKEPSQWRWFPHQPWAYRCTHIHANAPTSGYVPTHMQTWISTHSLKLAHTHACHENRGKVLRNGAYPMC